MTRNTDLVAQDAGDLGAAAEVPTEAHDRQADQVEPAPPERADHTGRWIIVALVLGYLIQVGWRLYLSRHLNAPAAHADEDGYLIAARAFTGGPGGPSTENTAFRRVGYPLLLSPIYWFTSNAFAVYKGAQIVNAIVNALVFPLTYLFGRRVLRTPPLVTLVTAFAAALLPAVVFYSEFAMTDAIIATLGLAWLLLIHRWMTGPTARARLIGAIGAGLAVGFIYLVHVRGTVLVAIHGLLVIALLLIRRTRLGLGVVSVAGAAVMVAFDPILKAILGNAIELQGRSPRAQTEAAVTSIGGIVRSITDGSGQIWVLGIGTFGIGSVGLAWTAWQFLQRRTLRQRLRDPQEGGRLVVLGTALVVTLLVAVSSAAALPPTDHRINYHAYPRYIHFMFPVWLMIGVAALIAAPRRRAIGLGIAGLAVVFLPAGVLYLKIHNVHGWRFMAFDAPESSFLGWDWKYLTVAQPTALAVAAFAVLWFVLQRRKTMLYGLAALVAVFAVMMSVTTQKVSVPMVNFQYLSDTPRLVRDLKLGPGDVVAESSLVGWYWPYNHAREIYWNRLLFFDSGVGANNPPPTAANVVIAPSSNALDGKRRAAFWNGSQFGFHVIANDPSHQWMVWRKDG